MSGSSVLASDVIQRVSDMLAAGGIGPSEREAQWLLEAATGITRARLANAVPLDPAAEAAVLALAERRIAGEPLQYITGLAGFRRLELEVGPGVFIPRPETELVAEHAMEALPRGGTLIEVGTGSGAIALAVADERPDAQVIGTETSTEALEWAIRNRDKLALEVELIECDLLEGLPASLAGHVDVIVSNPPYVPEGFVLPVEVREHEPHVALFAAGEGMSIIDRLTKQALEWLRPDGVLILEIGEVQRDAVCSSLIRDGYADVGVADDMSGRPRIAHGRAP
jgi:release factor glutamine methyltransferase